MMSALSKHPPVCDTSNQWFSIRWGECWTHIHITIEELLLIVVASQSEKESESESKYCSAVTTQLW